MSYIKYLILFSFLCACTPPSRAEGGAERASRYTVVCDQPGLSNPRIIEASDVYIDESTVKVYLTNGYIEYFVNVPCRILYRR